MNGLMEQDVLKIKDDISTIFDNVLGTRCSCEGLHNDGDYFWTPAVDVAETKDGFILKAALPGVNKEDVSTEIKEGLLTISGKRSACDCKESEDTTCLRQEIPQGGFYRAFRIGARIKTNAVKASFKDGILEINIPKAEEEKANKIAIE